MGAALGRKFSHAFSHEIKTLGEKWFRHCKCMQFNIGGERHYLCLADDKELPTPQDTGCGLLGNLEGKLGDEVLSFANEKEQAKKDKDAARTKLNSLLQSISTFKKLKELWPEGNEFYKGMDEDEKTKSGLPALRFDEVNANPDGTSGLPRERDRASSQTQGWRFVM